MQEELMRDILGRLREMGTQMSDQGELLAVIGAQVDGINQRLDILNGRVARSEVHIASLQTDKAVAAGRRKLAAWLWSIVGAGVVVILEALIPKLLR